jgi:hypothetical protein
MAEQWIANGHAMIARGHRVLTVLELCSAAPPESENAEVEGPFAVGNDIHDRRA